MSRLRIMIAAALGFVALLLLFYAAHSRSRWPLVAVGALMGLALWLSGTFMIGKGVARLAMPPGLIWLGLLALVLRALHQKYERLGIALVFIAYSLAGNNWVGSLLLRSLEADFSPTVIEDTFDAVLVLGGGTAVRPDGEAALSGSGDRVRMGAQIFHAEQTRHLIACGTSVSGLQQAGVRDLAAETRALWVGMGVPDRSILTVPGPRNTREEIAALALLIKENKWRRVGLVTSAWHLRRAIKLAQTHQLNLTPIGADYRGQSATYSLVGLIPSGNAFYRVRLALWEYLGALTGR